MGKKIMIGCPVNHQRDWVFPGYLKHIANLQYPKHKLHPCFLLNYYEEEQIERIKTYLDRFKEEEGDKLGGFTVHEAQVDENYKDGRIYGRRFSLFVKLRNLWLDMLPNDCTHLFSIDSDILIPPESVIKLMGWIDRNDYDAVAALVYNGPTQDGTNMQAFNFMTQTGDTHPDKGQNIYVHRNPGMLDSMCGWEATPLQGLAYGQQVYGLTSLSEVQMTGACYLFKRSLVDSGVRYGVHFQGEDVYWSEKARKKGFSLFLDQTLQPYHAMNEMEYAQRINLPPGFRLSRPALDPHLKEPDRDISVKVVKKW
jgi:hypothetical protein